MGVVLSAENVSIRYITGDFKDIGLKEYTVRKLTHNYHVNEFMAVENVSFQLEQGDMLGIIGANGAGKSTLLKAVAGIMEPSQGKISADGDIAALLELGSGFDGDLTVKENAYLRGAMLGYTCEFMDKTYDQIIEFAELEGLDDRPFKQLSSGMKSRLAFSIASLVKPDILILDEVLSVGDGAFQKKSAKKMREIIDQGAATILVSHSLDQIRELCNKVLWLNHGRQVAFGETQEICDQYERFLRGGCPAEMLGTNEEQEDKKQEAKVPTEAKISKVSRRINRRSVFASLVLALFFAIFVFNFGTRCLEKTQVSCVAIAAQEGSGKVIFRGAFVDGNWISPAENVSEGGGWQYDGGQDIYTAVDSQPLELLLPAGKGRELIFYAGPDAGVVSIDLDGEHFEFDLRHDTAEELGLAYQVPDSSIQSMLAQLRIIALISSVAVFAIYLILRNTTSAPVSAEREVWLDMLKVVSTIMVVMIHCAGDVYNNTFGADKTIWMQGLLANAIPRFAVPCFLMITGALSLGRQFGLRKAGKKVAHILIPLIFWSAIYVLFSKILWGNDVFSGLLRMPFEHQDATLWYAYQLIWLYLGMPFWTLLWDKLTIRKRWAFVAFSVAIPGLLTHIEEMLVLNANEYLPFASINPMLCYVGMLFLGRLLYDAVNSAERRKVLVWGISCSVFGLLLMVASSVYVSNLAQQSMHTFFSEVRFTGVIYGAGIFLCFGSLKDVLSGCSEWIKGPLRSLAGVSLGIYMTHALLIYKLLPQEIIVMGVSLNRSENVWQLVICVLTYYGMTAAICLLMAKIPFVRRLVQ